MSFDKSILTTSLMIGLSSCLSFGCAGSEKQAKPADEENFESRKQTAIEAEHDRENPEEIETGPREGKLGDSSARPSESAAEPEEDIGSETDDSQRADRETIPEEQLPDLGECDDGSNASACGMLEADGEAVRVTVQIAPALMIKGKGELDTGALKVANRENVANVLPCFAWAHQNEGATRVEYDIEYTVAEDGSVHTAAANPADMPVGAAGCIEQRIEGWKLPEPIGGPVTVIGTFLFTAK